MWNALSKKPTVALLACCICLAASGIVRLVSGGHFLGTVQLILYCSMCVFLLPGAVNEIRGR